MLLLLLLIIAILLMPLDAQEAAAQGVGAVLTHPLAPYFFAGALGALVVVLVAYNAVWNALAYSIYLDDVRKADDTYRKRRR
jgi:hypothetical protein